MQKITPFLWFDNQAEDAAKFYTSIFGESKTKGVDEYTESAEEVSGKPAGSVMTVTFEVEGMEIVALNGGPLFKFTPAISFSVHSATEEKIDEVWAKLSEGGSVLMPLQKYPFSEKYGWLNDKYGVSWQLMLSSEEPKISPSLLFVGEQSGRAKEAINFYVSVFKNSEIKDLVPYSTEEGDTDNGIKYGRFIIEGQQFVAMDSGLQHDFGFSLATSFVINCEDQQEVDYYWERLSANPAAEQCGWLQDKFGISWQVVPVILNKLVADPDREKADRVIKGMLQMKKMDVAGLQAAYDQE